MDISKSVLPKCGKKRIKQKNSNKSRQTGLVRDDSVNLELIKRRLAAAYLDQIARSSKGGRYRKSAKIDALRECKEEILEAHRIAQIFRKRNVNISTQHFDADDQAVY